MTELESALKEKSNLRRIINIGSGWFLAHGKCDPSLRLDRHNLRHLTDEGPLKLYHKHPDGWCYPYWHRGGGICSGAQCYIRPPKDVVGRAVFMSRSMGKHVLGFKLWKPCTD